MNNNQQIAVIKKLGQNIRKIRKSKGYSMEAIANQIDMEYRQYGRIERGEINTTVLSLFKISTCLQVSIKDLFDFAK